MSKKFITKCDICGYPEENDEEPLKLGSKFRWLPPKLLPSIETITSDVTGLGTASGREYEHICNSCFFAIRESVNQVINEREGRYDE